MARRMKGASSRPMEHREVWPHLPAHDSLPLCLTAVLPDFLGSLSQLFCLQGAIFQPSLTNCYSFFKSQTRGNLAQTPQVGQEQ